MALTMVLKPMPVVVMTSWATEECGDAHEDNYGEVSNGSDIITSSTAIWECGHGKERTKGK